MNVSDHSNRCLLVRRIDYNLIGGGYSKDHSVRKIQEGDLRHISCLLEEVRVELDARCVGLEAREHECRLAKSVLEEAIHSVGVVAPRLNGLSVKVIEACRWCNENVAIRAPVEAPHERLVFHIIEEQPVRSSPRGTLGT